MERIVECIPNVSEGRNPEVIGAILDAVRAVRGVVLLDASSDESHDRTVITFLGEPEAVVEAAVKLACTAAARIDLTTHRGEHPRMGAVDVIPLVPLRGISVEETVALSRRLAARVWEEAGIPAFLYEKSASAPHRVNLADIRRGQFEGMARKVQEPEWEPDFGGRRIHPTAGVVAVGCRMPLVAFNIDLSTPDVAVASLIAKRIRTSSGGFPCVKALGVMLEPRHLAQVSINMTDTATTPLHVVFEAVRAEAATQGVEVVGAGIVGLVPMRALVDAAVHFLQIADFDPDRQVLENHLG
jgi:glutamate formiminotransferase / 5-formyltetrahydrofolate cyclo-ligase